MATRANPTKLMEQRLLDVSVKYSDKIQCLTSTWNLLKEQKEEGTFQDSFNFLMRNSINLVLKPDWRSIKQAMKTHLKCQVSDCERLKKRSEHIASQCQSLCNLLDEPWGNPTLSNIIQVKPYDEQAALSFLEADRYILESRLNILCEDKKCYDIAQRLAAVVWMFYKRDRRLLSFLPDNELHYILDLWIVLLVRQNKHKDVTDQMKEVPLSQGLLFIKRLKTYNPVLSGKSKIWKKSRNAAQTVVFVFLPEQ